MHFVKIGTNVMDDNNKIANHIRHELHDHGIYMCNIMSAPGAGKTSTLEAILPELTKKYKIAIIEGDMQGSADADRIAKFPVEKIVQISTHSLCHLESKMIENALSEIDFHNIDCIIVENVGNLVCPAEFDLGEDEKIMIVSVTEGHDKPHKYPIMFRGADLIILNKIDLIKYTNFDKSHFYKELSDLKYKTSVIEIAANKSDNTSEIVKYLTSKIEEKKNHVSFHSNENHKH